MCSQPLQMLHAPLKRYSVETTRYSHTDGAPLRPSMSPDPSSPFYACPWKPPCNPLAVVHGRRVKGGTRSISVRPARSVAARPGTSSLEHPPTSSSMRFDGRAQRPIDQAPLISAAGLPSDALEHLYRTNTFTLDTSMKAGPNFGLHAAGGVATHRHGWRMQGLRVPPVPKAARGAVSKPPPGPWISAAPTPPYTEARGAVLLLDGRAAAAAERHAARDASRSDALAAWASAVPHRIPPPKAQCPATEGNA